MHINNLSLNNVELTLVLESLDLKIKMHKSEIIKESSKTRSIVMINELEKLYKKLI